MAPVKDVKKPPAKAGARWLAPAVVLLLAVLGVFAGSFYLRWREARTAELKVRIRQIRVEVLNGTPRGGLGQVVATRLRRAGFDVVDIANAENDSFPETVVVDRADVRAANAALVSRILQCPNVIPQLEPTSLLEVTVIIGKDYLTDPPKKFLGLEL